MLEKKKKWCCEKVEKGKKWIKDHRFGLWYAVGVTTTVGLSCVMAKIFEPKKTSIQTIPISQGDKNGFALRTIGIDRFGRNTCEGPWVNCLDEFDKDHLSSNIDAALRGEKGVDYED